MKTTNGKLRNVTSGILHTEIGDVYKFYEQYLGAEGIMTHQLPSAGKALDSILKRKLTDEWFTKEWIQDKEWLAKEVEIADLTQEEKDEFWKEYQVHASAMWDNIKDKTIAVKV